MADSELRGEAVGGVVYGRLRMASIRPDDGLEGEAAPADRGGWAGLRVVSIVVEYPPEGGLAEQQRVAVQGSIIEVLRKRAFLMVLKEQ